MKNLVEGRYKDIRILIIGMVIANLILCYPAKALENSNNLIEDILKSNSGIFGEILKNPEKYEVQVIYTKISRDENRKPSFTTHTYRVNKEKYFYPGSSVKLSACALALEKLNNLNIDKDTSLKIEKGRTSQTSVNFDRSSENKLPSIAQYIKKVLVVSDNDGFDRLYEFLGQEYYNETLWEKGYKDTLILHRLGSTMSNEENKYTNPMTFYVDKKEIYKQPLVYNSKNYSSNLEDITKGKGYYSGNSLIKNPKDFSKSNYFSLEALHGVLKAIIFPEYVEEKQRFNLTKDDYEFLKKYMSIYPRQCSNPKYNFKDSHVKYFMFGDTNVQIPENIKIYNKIGCAYGYLIDNAYITDEEKNIEFMLTSVIYVNDNEIFNDNKYEYEKIGMPFLSSLGRAIYEYELREKI